MTILYANGHINSRTINLDRFLNFHIFDVQSNSSLLVWEGRGQGVPSPKINLQTQANKHNQTPRITLTRGLKDQMAVGTSKSQG